MGRRAAAFLLLLVFPFLAPFSALGDGLGDAPGDGEGATPGRPESLRAALDLALSNPGAEFDSALETVSSMEGARRWLGGLPTLSLTHLESDRSLGTDETEVSLNFPVKSPLQRDSDNQLESVDPRLDAAMNRYRAWYLSGTLRDLYARVQKAQAVLPAAETAAKLLADMESRLQKQLSARSAEQFDVIAIQQQRLNAEGRLAALRADIAGASRQFASLTAGSTMPDVSGDSAALPRALLYDNHPLLESLSLNRDQQLAALRATSANATPWNVALVGRELTIPSFTEQQIGVAIDIPFSFGESASASTRSSERALQRTFQMQRD
uniref:hypothetical protein n=1 Tax=Congregibacter sp. TaxID=2744308 RepID=UPI003F6AFC73